MILPVECIEKIQRHWLQYPLVSYLMVYSWEWQDLWDSSPQMQPTKTVKSKLPSARLASIASGLILIYSNDQVAACSRYKPFKMAKRNEKKQGTVRSRIGYSATLTLYHQRTFEKGSCHVGLRE